MGTGRPAVELQRGIDALAVSGAISATGADATVLHGIEITATAEDVVSS